MSFEFTVMTSIHFIGCDLKLMMQYTQHMLHAVLINT